MKTTNPIENVIASIIATGLTFEAYSNIESRDTFIGIKNSSKKFVWDWFTGHSYYGGGFSLDFDYSYNQNTGKSQKSIMHKIKTREIYENMLNVEMDFIIFN